eukprot:GHVO01036043.1.p1 GENE.GHVO01036043.1~~GHVO01036043.1.p1  ORF type:complete len:213 (+),score=13.93 GHVO01036043.1:1974-2612(+)
MDCVSAAGTATCSCKTGFTRLLPTICKDVDECEEDMHNCNETISSCINLPGTYECGCFDGYRNVNGTCKDVCDPNPCKNGGECKSEKDYFSCMCDGMWTGHRCEEEHEEAIKYRNIAIGVGVGIGVLCLILLVIACCACCRKRYRQNRYSYACRSYEDGQGYGNGTDITLDKWQPSQQPPGAPQPNYQDASDARTAPYAQGVQNPAYTDSYK